MIDFRYKLIGKVDVSSWKEKVKTFSNDDWEEFDFRQKTFSVHKDTRTIPIIFDEDFIPKNEYTKTKWYDLFSDEIKVLEKKFKNYYGFGNFSRIILVKQLSNTSIDPHIDSGKTLNVGCRVHIPIDTNENVIFIIDGEEKNMKEGEMWEINNREKMHSVSNNSEFDRVHLIIDYIMSSVWN